MHISNYSYVSVSFGFVNLVAACVAASGPPCRLVRSSKPLPVARHLTLAVLIAWLPVTFFSYTCDILASSVLKN